MPKSTEVKTETSAQELPKLSEKVPQKVSETENKVAITNSHSPEPVGAIQDIDDVLNSLKTLLSSLEKLQKVRQEVGNIKPLLGRILDGELLAGEELEQVKTGVSGLVRLVRAYSDHQTALEKAQPARNLLDQVLKEHQAN
ncbi:hypothetical protein G7B40_021375 [Aetokthonos hydrillicola Thurmond2011]|jgi:dsDNA-specific endonuclease/ATPase MutS2|uniref:Uncharacterized protein n=1 Tax=Aetokthonos hydrillicola Thurmond2011 TaxID=2712845 RepID=A0AAP5M9C2_9CYAN|nr:hypothetical protein [Aetokthonos hydrillicola]MBO3457721.1 hypothetical protein [Aetokthonos hydrillicola CCALA 1050]MBW4589428.1 hypothetical protein [Aetokthonos hydrillicola CCALA 1050]MDR9897095.1 hypothetical protein [Aetokthonos hydrillicola Thurmond2011]